MNNYTFNPINTFIPTGKNSTVDDALVLTSVEKGFELGNLFKNIYWPYKYEANVTGNNERENLLQKVQEYTFATIELDLYLDIFPNDRQAIGLFNQYTDEAKKYQKQYESKYGPLLLSSNPDGTPWEWISNPWPWEKQ